MNEESRYGLRGVSASKTDVHEAVKQLDKGLFPNAFCKILPDYAAGDDKCCNIMHADTAGTKTSLSYLYWKETGDSSVWKGIAQDAIIMNIDDLICVGATDHIIVSSTIGRNRALIPAEVIKALITGTAQYLKELQGLGVNAHLAGGETADVGDIVRTLDVGITAFSRMLREDVVEIDIREGDVIVGLASFGQASYEKEYNSGIGSNGLTSARHDVLSKYLTKKYPESFDPSLPEELTYSGTKKLTDIESTTGLPVGKLLLSPTRTYSPIIKKVLENHRKEIHGIVHCSGGGQTKALNFINNLHLVKDNLFDLPPLFRMIQSESDAEWQEMYKVFNMGHRMEIYVPPSVADAIIAIANKFDVEAKVVGKCERSTEKELTIKSEFGEFHYR